MKMGNRRTQKTLDTLREHGCLAKVVEKWNSFGGAIGGPGIRQDFLGIIDIIAMNSVATIGVQATSVGQMAEHRDTIRKAEHTVNWLTGPRFLILAGWDQKCHGGEWRPQWERALMNADGDIDFRPMKPEDLTRMTVWEGSLSNHGKEVYPY